MIMVYFVYQIIGNYFLLFMRYPEEPINDIIDPSSDNRLFSDGEWSGFFLRRMIRIGSPVWLLITRTARTGLYLHQLY
jgi:hypothetical protein